MLGKYEIGTAFKTRGNHPRTCVVTDIYRTYNSQDKLVRLRYVATHQFSDQTVTDYDVVETTISRGLLGDAN